jgi:hypothetical protein
MRQVDIERVGLDVAYEWREKNKYLKAESNGAEYFTFFYNNIFPYYALERKGHYEDNKPNAIAVQLGKNGKNKKRIITADLKELNKFENQPFVIMAPIGYFGKKRLSKNASLLFAIAIDLDGVMLGDNIQSIVTFTKKELLPKPTYIVNSGNGLHLYYVLKKPIKMYENYQKEMMDALDGDGI